METGKGRIRTLRRWPSLPEVMGEQVHRWPAQGKPRGRGQSNTQVLGHALTCGTEKLRPSGCIGYPGNLPKLESVREPARAPPHPPAPARGGASPAPTGSRGGREK